MAEVKLDFNAGADQLLTNIKNVRNELSFLATEHKATIELLTKGFQQAAVGADSYETQLAGTTKKERELAEANTQLVAKMKELETQMKKSVGTAEVEKLTEKIKQLETQIKALQNQDPFGKPVGDKAKNATGNVHALVEAIQLAKQQLAGMDASSGEFNKLSDEIKAAEIAFQRMGHEGEESGDKLESARKKLAEYKKTLQDLALAGLQNTETYKNLKKEAGELDDTIRDVNEEIKAIGSDTSKLDQLIRGIQLGTAAFGAYEGVVALTGARNEEFEKVLTKLNALMTITNSLQAIMTELRRKDSVVTMLQVGAQKLWTLAVGETTGAVRILRIALASIGIGLAIAGIVLLISKIQDWTDATRAQVDEQKRLNVQMETSLKLSEGTLQALESFTEKRIAQMEAAGKSAQEIREAELEGLQMQLEQSKKLEEQQRANGERALFVLGEIAAGRMKANADFIDETQKTADTYNSIQEKRLDLENKLEIKRLNNIRDTNEEIASFNEEVEEKRKAASEKADADRKARLENLLKLERELAAARLETLKDGRSKDIASENLSSSNSIGDLERARDERGRSQKEIVLYNQLIQQEQINHRARLLAIDLKYYKDAQAAFEETSEQINDVFLSDADRELNAATTKYNALFKQIDEARKKQLELAGTGFSDPAVLAELNQSEIDLRKKLEDEKLRIQADAADKRLQAEQQMALQSVDLIVATGKDETKITREKENLKYEIEKEFASRRLKLITDRLGLEEKFTKEQIDKLLDQTTIRGAAAKNMDVLEFVGIEIDDVEAKQKILDFITSLQSKGQQAADPKEKFSLGKFIFGDDIDEDELQAIGDSFTNLFDQIAAAREMAVQREIEAIDKRLDKLDEEVDAQQDAVDREKELQDEGVANNYDSERQKLDDLKAQQDAELKAREDQMKKVEQIRRQEAALRSVSIAAQGIEQAVNMTTAATEIFKAHSGIPFAGVVIAAAALATMIATFLSIKNSIKAATAPSFARGGLFDALKDGSDHAQGGVNVVDSRSGKKLAEFEKDEQLFVVNKGSSRRNRRVLEAINENRLGMAIDRNGRLLTPIGIRMNEQVASGIVQNGERAAAERDLAFSRIAEHQSVSYLASIDDKMSQVVENTSTTAQSGDRVERYGSHKRVIKKS